MAVILAAEQSEKQKDSLQDKQDELPFASASWERKNWLYFSESPAGLSISPALATNLSVSRSKEKPSLESNLT